MPSQSAKEGYLRTRSVKTGHNHTGLNWQYISIEYTSGAYLHIVGKKNVSFLVKEGPNNKNLDIILQYLPA